MNMRILGVSLGTIVLFGVAYYLGSINAVGKARAAVGV